MTKRMREMPSKIAYLWPAIFFAFQLYADEAIRSSKILQVSTSGRSIALDRGAMEGIKEGSHAKILLQLGTPEEPILVKIAEGEVMKALPNSSYWLLRNLEASENLQKGQEVIYLLQDKNVAGVEEEKVLKRKVILAKDQLAIDYLKATRRGLLPNELIQEDEKDFRSSSVNKPTIELKPQDFEAQEYDEWVEQKGLRYVEAFMDDLEVKHVNRPEKFKDLSAYKKRRERAVFESYIEATDKKLKEKSLEEIYERALADKEESLLRKGTTINNTYANWKKDLEEEEVIDSRHKVKEKVEGKRWSASMEDEELRSYVVKSGIAEEKLRQDRALSEAVNNEIFVSYTPSLLTHATENDENYQSSGYSVEFGYDWYLIRLSRRLRSMTIKFIGERSLNYIAISDSLNGRFVDTTFGLSLQYYFWNEPYTLRKLSWYAGLGFKNGSSTMGNNDLTQPTYEHSVTSLPTFSLGVKYRFRPTDEVGDRIKIGMGIQGGIQYERRKYTNSEEINDDIQGDILINDTKLVLGFGIYF